MNSKVILVVAAIAVIILSTLVLQNSKTITSLETEIATQNDRAELLAHQATLEAARATKVEAEAILMKEKLEVLEEKLSQCQK